MRTSRPIRRSVLFFISLLMTLTACQAPLIVPIDEVCQIENHEKTLTTDGYFSLDDTLRCSDATGDKRCGIVLNRYPKGDVEISAALKEGKGRNRMLSMFSGYTEADLKIRTDSDDLLSVGEHVTVTGEVHFEDNACVIYVDKIEVFRPAP